MNQSVASDDRFSPEVRAYAVITGTLLMILMLLGVIFRGAHAGWIVALWPLSLEPVYTNLQGFYFQALTIHGIGMVGIAVLGGMAIQWHFLGKYVTLHREAALANLGFFMFGVVLILTAILIGHYATAWTMLYPLASHGHLWSPWAAVMYLSGVLSVGIGFVIFYIDCAMGIYNKFGSFGTALGWKLIASGKKEDAPPAAVIAATVCTIANLIASIELAVVLLMMIFSVMFPDSISYSALLVKNLIFFGGHVAINVAMYMAVIALYEILPRYTGRPWGVYPIFAIAWNFTLFMVMAVYPHHLLQDFALPDWAAVMGQILSYASVLPVVAVTMVGTLANVHKSGMRWDLTSSFLVLAVFGWAAGSFPAAIDGTVYFNVVLHNTNWVPGHFHTYLLLGLVPLNLGFMAWLANRGEPYSMDGMRKILFWIFVTMGLGFVITFLVEGANGVVRRYPIHSYYFEMAAGKGWGWEFMAEFGSFFSAVTFFAAIALIIPILVRLAKGDEQMTGSVR